MADLPAIHPGEILKEEFMAPLNLSINQLARDLDVPPNRISALVNGKRALTADTALRLERYFKVESQFWLNLQMLYELELAREQVGEFIIQKIVPRDQVGGQAQ